MPLNYTIDAQSPILSYVGSGWAPISSTRDASYASYNNKTAVTTNHFGDTMTFSFFGTAIWMFGAMRPNHGAYTVQLDGNTTTSSGYSPIARFGMTIFNKTNLSRSQHTIVLTEASDDEAHPWVDLDYVVLEDDDPSLASSVSTLFIDNTDAALQFFPGPWDVVSDSSSFQGSFSRTQLASARVELEFTGSTISLYGRVAPENGLYLCNIDGGANQSFTGYSPQAASQQTLFFANNLKGGSTRHVLQVYNEPQGGENGTSGIEIDFVRIWGNEISMSSGPSPSGSSKAKLVGGILGGLLGAGAILLVLFLLLLLARRRKRDDMLDSSAVETKSPHDRTALPDAEEPGSAGLGSLVEDYITIGWPDRSHEPSQTSSSDVMILPALPSPNFGAYQASPITIDDRRIGYTPSPVYRSVESTPISPTRRFSRTRVLPTPPISSAYNTQYGPRLPIIAIQESPPVSRIVAPLHDSDAGLLMTDQDDGIRILGRQSGLSVGTAPPDYSSPRAVPAGIEKRNSAYPGNSS